MSRWNLAWLIGLPIFFLVSLTMVRSAPIRGTDKDYQRVQLLVNVFSEIDRHFVRELDDKQKAKLIEDMINGGLERIDPYSVYLNPEEYRQFNASSQGSFGGIGITLGVDQKTGMMQIVAPMIGTPAWDAGIQSGDLLLKIDDTPTETMKLSDIIALIQGEPGSVISLTVQHDASRKIETCTMKRAKIEVPSVLGWARRDDDPKEWDYFVDPASKIACIRLLQFSETSTRDLTRAMNRIIADGAKGLVLDLRDNPGGLLSSAVEIGDLFLKSGRIVSTKDRNGRGQEWDAKEDGTLFEPAESHPMVVLINRSSASASEIVAAALQDHARAVVIGERTYGKGSVQKVLTMGDTDNPAALKLTTNSYWRPNGKNIHRHPDSKETDDWGVRPDPGYEIVLKDEERLDYARSRRTRDGIRGRDLAKPPEGGKAFTDRAMDKAMEYLKGKI